MIVAEVKKNKTKTRTSGRGDRAVTITMTYTTSDNTQREHTAPPRPGPLACVHSGPLQQTTLLVCLVRSLLHFDHHRLTAFPPNVNVRPCPSVIVVIQLYRSFSGHRTLSITNFMSPKSQRYVTNFKSYKSLMLLYTYDLLSCGTKHLFFSPISLQ